jgi:hypothetical protein
MEPVVYLSPLDYRISLSPEEEGRIDQVVSVFREKREIDQETSRYIRHILKEMPSPSTTLVLIDDLSAIAHVERIKNVGTYSSRAFTRARQGDIVLASLEPTKGYHDYIDHRLGLGNSHFVFVPPYDPERNYYLFESLKRDRSARDKILAYAPPDEDLVIHPYMGSYGAWDIAALLSEARQQPVKVMGPLPKASQIANNKNDLLSLVRELCGNAHVIDHEEINNRDRLEAALEEKILQFEQLVIRFPGSAGGMTTELVKRADILDRKGDFRTFIDSYLKTYGWEEGKENLQVSGWEPQVIMAPSSHLWIPPETDQLPVFEEVLLQSFSKDNPLMFAGSRVADLPASITMKIGKLTLIMGRALQKLGYVGRCSFDFILCGPSIEKGVVKFVECNGRWGGASTPMTLMNRIFGDHRKHAYVHSILQVSDFQGLSFERFVERFDDILFDRRTGKGYAIVYNVALLESHGQLDLIIIGDSYEEAKQRMERFESLVSQRMKGSQRLL